MHRPLRWRVSIKPLQSWIPVLGCICRIWPCRTISIIIRQALQVGVSLSRIRVLEPSVAMWDWCPIRIPIILTMRLDSRISIAQRYMERWISFVVMVMQSSSSVVSWRNVARLMDLDVMWSQRLVRPRRSGVMCLWTAISTTVTQTSNMPVAGGIHLVVSGWTPVWWHRRNWRSPVSNPRVWVLSRVTSRSIIRRMPTARISHRSRMSWHSRSKGSRMPWRPFWLRKKPNNTS